MTVFALLRLGLSLPEWEAREALLARVDVNQRPVANLDFGQEVAWEWLEGELQAGR